MRERGEQINLQQLTYSLVITFKIILFNMYGHLESHSSKTDSNSSTGKQKEHGLLQQQKCYLE
jgi:hypothetical protein